MIRTDVDLKQNILRLGSKVLADIGTRADRKLCRLRPPTDDKALVSPHTPRHSFFEFFMFFGALCMSREVLSLLVGYAYPRTFQDNLFGLAFLLSAVKLIYKTFVLKMRNKVELQLR